MALQETQSNALLELGVSYPQLIDYYSKQYTATLVGLSHCPQTVDPDQYRSKSVVYYW